MDFDDDFDIASLLQQELQDGTQTVPNSVFDRIQADIAAKKRKKRLLWWLFLFGSGLLMGWLTHSFWPTTSAPCNCVLKKGETHVFTRKHNLSQSSEKDVDSNQMLMSSPIKEYSYSLLKNSSNTLNKASGNNSDNENQQIATAPLTKVLTRTKPMVKTNTVPPYKLPKKAHDFSPFAFNFQLPKNDPAPPFRLFQAIPFLHSSALSDTSFALKPLTKNQTQRNIGTLYTYGGPTLFQLAIFKPYFNSGALSNRSFEASGQLWGIGIRKNLSQHWILALETTFDRKRASFQYDLMIDEADYFDLYQNGELIPLDQLDDPDDCDCFLAEDATLTYQLSTFGISAGIGYQWNLHSKLNLISGIHGGVALRSRFLNLEQAVIAFPTTLIERFSTFTLAPYLDLQYQATSSISIGIRPHYILRFPFSSSTIYTSRTQTIALPLTLSYRF